MATSPCYPTGKSVKRRVFSVTSVAVLFVMLMIPSVQATELILNGDFETFSARDRSNGWVTFSAGQTIGEGWIVSANTVDLHWGEYGNAWSTVSGFQALDLTGGGRGAIYQDVATTTGMNYMLQFYMSANLA